ncbi:MAG: fibronectin type III domain-containing protein [Acidimicrobiales bacterium]
MVALTGSVPVGAASSKPVAPDAPTGVQVVGGYRSAVVTWTAVTPPPGEFILAYMATAVAGAEKRHCRAPGPTTTCTFAGLRNGTTFDVEVRATNGTTRSPYSTPVTVDPGTPDAPSGVQATIATGQSTVSFDAPDDNRFPITGYTVTATDATDPANGGQVVTGSSSPITVTGLTDGDSYTFTVVATNKVGTGAPSAPTGAVVPVPVPGTPTDVTAVGGAGQATVSFTPPAGLAESFTATATDTSNAGDGGESATGSSSPITVTGLTGGDSYTFTVTADNGPVEGAPSVPSAPVVPTTLVTVTATGSSYAALAIQQWVGQVSTLFGLDVGWQVSSSVIGLNLFAQNEVDIAASDIPYSAEQSTFFPDQPYQYLPDVAGGLGFMFNLIGTNGQRITDLNLTATLIGQIFLGEITKWDDPAIVAANPQLAGDLPGTTILPVYRADQGGENYLLSDYLLHEDGADFTAAQTAFEWGIPGQPSATWPVPAPSARISPDTYPGWAAGYPIGENGSDNAADYVAAPSSVGAITYVAPAFAAEHGFPMASVVNASGDPVQPTSVDVATALESATFNADMSQNLSGVYSSTEADAYPLSWYSYLVAPCSPSLASAQGASCDGPDVASPFAADKGQVLGQFVAYLACAGQQHMSDLGYAPLPPNLVQADFDAIGRINGAVVPPAPTAANCADPYVDGETVLPGG